MSTVEVIALKPFCYSVDGYTSIPVQEHERFDLPERFFAGLNDARYVRRATIGDGKVSLKAEPRAAKIETAKMVDAAIKQVLEDAYKSSTEVKTATIPETAYLPTAEPREKPEAVEIPDDWRSLKWFALRSLASKISDTPIKTSEDAVAAIEAELARRSQG